MSKSHATKTLFVFSLLCLLFFARNTYAEEAQTVNLVSELQLKHQMSQHEAAEQVERIFSLIREDLKKGKAIEIRNFGRFGVRVAKVRQKKVAAFQGPLPEPAKKRAPQFSPAPSLREDLNSLGS